MPTYTLRLRLRQRLQTFRESILVDDKQKRLKDGDKKRARSNVTLAFLTGLCVHNCNPESSQQESRFTDTNVYKDPKGSRMQFSRQHLIQD